MGTEYNMQDVDCKVTRTSPVPTRKHYVLLYIHQEHII